MKTNPSSDTPSRPALIFMGIDAQGGKFRLALTMAFFLFCWSFLAILDYYFNPLPNVSSHPSTWLNVASDAGLFRPMLDHYFSMFSMLNLATMTTLWLLGFQSAEAVITNALQLSNPRFTGRLLRKRAYPNRTPYEIDTAIEGFQGTDAGKVISQLGGPCLIRLNPGYGAFIENRISELHFLQAAAGSDQVFIDNCEKLISILPTRQSEFKLCFSAICGDGTRLSIKDMRIAAANPIVAIVADYVDRQPVEIPIKNLDDLNLHVLTNWDGFAIEVLQSEIKSFFLKSIKENIKEILSNDSGYLLNTFQKNKKQQFHSENHHHVKYPLSGLFLRRKKTGFFPRNRRRSMMPELRFVSSNVEQSDSQSFDFLVELQKYLTQNCKRIYNNAIENPRIVSPGEITVE